MNQSLILFGLKLELEFYQRGKDESLSLSGSERMWFELKTSVLENNKKKWKNIQLINYCKVFYSTRRLHQLQFNLISKHIYMKKNVKFDLACWKIDLIPPKKLIKPSTSIQWIFVQININHTLITNRSYDEIFNIIINFYFTKCEAWGKYCNRSRGKLDFKGSSGKDYGTHRLN